MSHQGYQQLSTKDVVFVESLPNSASLFKTDATLRGKDLLTKVEAICVASGQFSVEEVKLLFGDGLNCELLRPGATDWQQGRLQLRLGFEQSATVTTDTAMHRLTSKPIAIPTTPTASSAVPAVSPTIATASSTVPAVNSSTDAVSPVAPAVIALTDGTSSTVATVSPTVSPVNPTPAPAASAVVTPSVNTSVPIDRASIATPIVKNDPPVAPEVESEPELELELDINQFTNATDHGNDLRDQLDIDHSDVFSLMEDPDITPLDDDFSFNEVLESMAELEFEPVPAATKSIASPWDLEELDGMLVVK